MRAKGPPIGFGAQLAGFALGAIKRAKSANSSRFSHLTPAELKSSKGGGEINALMSRAHHNSAHIFTLDNLSIQLAAQSMIDDFPAGAYLAVGERAAGRPGKRQRAPTINRRAPTSNPLWT